MFPSRSEFTIMFQDIGRRYILILPVFSSAGDKIVRERVSNGLLRRFSRAFCVFAFYLLRCYAVKLFTQALVEIHIHACWLQCRLYTGSWRPKRTFAIKWFEYLISSVIRHLFTIINFPAIFALICGTKTLLIAQDTFDVSNWLDEQMIWPGGARSQQCQKSLNNF